MPIQSLSMADREGKLFQKLKQNPKLKIFEIKQEDPQPPNKLIMQRIDKVITIIPSN